jgi:hypothetical protein
MVHYFAYGPTMHPIAMAAACPAAEPLGLAMVPGWRVTVGRLGLATLAPRLDSEACGMLWRVSAADLATLDALEGVEAGEYHRLTLLAFGPERRPVEVEVHIADDARPGDPDPSYAQDWLAAAEAAGLTDDHLLRVRAWATQPMESP